MWPFRTGRIPSTPTPPADDEPFVTAYGHYRVLQREDGNPWHLGHGAMGITYKAEDVNLRAPVALKVISPLIAEQPGARELFLAEARGAASLRHRNAASVHHLGVNRTGELFFAMEFIEGETVEALLARQHRLPVPLALDFAQQAACALAAAGRRGLVHRDLKPANLMLSDEGDGTIVVKVIDFGLCKSLPTVAGAAGPGRTGVGRALEDQFFGTPFYASPEQFRCDPNLDQRSDFYSLGATLWKMLSGRPVFSGSSTHIRRCHLEDPLPFDDLPDDVSPPVRALLANLLHKEAAGRPQTPLELIDRIEGAAYDHRGADEDPRKHWKTQGCVPLLGSVLAHNYHLEAVMDENPGAGKGPVFRAEDIAGHRFVAVHLLDRTKPLEAIRARVERLAAAPHPNLLLNHTLSSCRGQPFVVNEWLNGFALSEVLHAHGGRLPLAETRTLLRQVMLAVDHARENEIGLLDLNLAAIQVHFGGDDLDAPSRRSLLSKPLADWPNFTLKLRPRAGEFGGDPETLTRESLRQLGQLAAELLGSREASTAGFAGLVSDGGEDAVRLPAVPLEVQHLINQALSSRSGFSSGSEFVAALTLAGNVEGATR